MKYNRSNAAMLSLVAAATIAGCAANSQTGQTETRGGLTSTEIQELSSATSRGMIAGSNSIEESLSLVSRVEQSERTQSGLYQTPSRVYGRSQPQESILSARTTIATMRPNGLTAEQIRTFGEQVKARLTPTEAMLESGRQSLQELRNRTLVQSTNSVSTVSQRSGTVQVGLMYDDGTVTNPARPIHGTSGDHVLRFSFTPSEPGTAPTAQRITVNLQLGGSEVGHINPPTGENWRTPLTGKVYNVVRTGLLSIQGRMIILDAQTQPVEFGTTGTWRDAKLFVYQYSFSPTAGFQATHVRTVVIPKAQPTVPSPSNPFPWVIGSGAVFPGSIAFLDVAATENQMVEQDPDVVITDNFNGIYCTSGNLSSVGLCALDSRMAGGVRAGVIHGVGPDGNYDVITPPPPGSPPEYAGLIGIYPGAHSVASVVVRGSGGTITQNKICWSVSYSNNSDGSPNPQGMGLHCIDRTELTNQTISPVMKTHDPAFGGFGSSHEVVVSGTTGFGDLVDAVDNDRWNAPEMLYWMRAPADSTNLNCPMQSALRRINLVTRQVELVRCDTTRFGWTNETSSSPTFIGFPVSKQIPSVGQEYNNPNLNMLISLGLRPEAYFMSSMPTVIAPTFSTGL